MAKLLGLFALACLVASAWASEPLRVNHEDIARRYDYRLSLKKPFLFFGTLPSFDLHGHAISSTESIRLTTSVPKMRGSVWAQEPNPYRAWQLHFSLGISGRTYLGDDGIALWYTSQKGVEGPVYGSQDQWKGLGIFFDSSDVNTNRVTPYVSAYLNDGSYEMSLDNNAGSSSIGGCFRDFRNSPKPIWGRLTYANRTLRLDLDMMQDGYAFTECFTRVGVDLPPKYFFGVSASTGEHMGDDHDLYAFETFEVDPKPKKTKKRISKLDHQTEEKIEDIKKAINEAQKKQEKMPGQLGFQEILSPKVLNDLLESQFRVIDNLNLLHGKAGLAPIIAAGVHERATEHVKNAVGSVDATVDAIAKKVDDVSSQVKALSDNVQELFIAFREFNTQGDQGIREVNDKLQASQEKLQAAHQAIKDAPSSSHWGFSLSFFMLGGIIVYAASVFVRMGKNDSKRFV